VAVYSLASLKIVGLQKMLEAVSRLTGTWRERYMFFYVAAMH